MNKKIALVTYQQQEKYFAELTENEDRLLLTFLREKGLDIEPVVWNNPSVNWMLYDAALIKSPWDYHENLDLFLNWTTKVQGLGVRLLNPAETIVWNSNKKYLIEISDAGLPIIPSKLLKKGSIPEWIDLFKTWNTDKIVVKPCVSAGAKNTSRLHIDAIADKRAELEHLLQGEDFLAQPYLKEIEQGEWSFLFFGQKFSHVLLKTPKDGDFRVQHDHGGSFRQADVADVYLKKAAAYVDQFAKGSLYVRVDGIIKDNEFYLMELEMIEPYLYLSTAEISYENYYHALMDMIS